MIDYTADFKTAALLNRRDPRARVEVTWTDPSIDTTLQVSSNDDNRVTFNQQVVDGDNVTSEKWAHLNTAIIADGSFKLMPAYPSEGQVGWYGATPCNASKIWAGTNPILTVEFTSRPIEYLYLTGDTVYGEYPEEFTIRLYNGVSLLATEAVTGNSTVSATIDLLSHSIVSCDSFTVEVIKWSAANQVVKINECYAPILDLYYGDEITELGILEEMQAENGSLPIGNISSNELSLGLSDDSRRFQFGNTNSKYHTLLKKNRKIKVWLGFVLPSGSSDVSSGSYIVETINGDIIGFHPYGVYWSGDWNANIREASVDTDARDLMEILRTTEYNTSPVWEGQTLYKIASDIMLQAVSEIVGLTYEIDTALQNYTIPVGYFERQSYFQTIKDIVSVAQSIAYVDRTGKLYIGKTI